MNPPRQKHFLLMGQSGCLLFSMIDVAEGICGCYIDSYLRYKDFLSQGIIKDDCYVNDLNRAFSLLTGQIWECTKEEMSYQCKPNEVEITRFEKQGTINLVTHFVHTDGAGLVEYDPLALDLSSWKATKKYIWRRKS